MNKTKSSGFKSFQKDELVGFIHLYNLASNHLSYSRTNYGNTETTEYLNRLVASAHNMIYSTKTSNIKSLTHFYFREFPRLISKNWAFLLTSALLLLGGVLFSYIYTLLSPDNAAAFLPEAMLQQINFGGKAGVSWNGSIMSSMIMTNNIKVGFAAFALGVTLGIGTAWSLVYNGFILGSLAALAQHSSATLKFWSLILPHGILELFAIFVCGGAGLILGSAIIAPGVYSRKDSFTLRGRIAVKLVLGTIPLFIIAGLIEGFITPLGIPEIVKLIFAAGTLLALIFYIWYFNVNPHPLIPLPHQERED